MRPCFCAFVILTCIVSLPACRVVGEVGDPDCASSDALCEDRPEGEGEGEVTPTTFPELDDPDRESAPFECQGAALSLEEFLPYVAQGRGSLQIQNGLNFNGSAAAVRTLTVFRSCNEVTGCTEWQSFAGSGAGSYYQLTFGVRASGAFELLHHEDDGGPVTAIPIETTDAQLPLVGLRTTRPFRVRMTRSAEGTACISIASTVARSAEPDGSTGQEFELAVMVGGPARRFLDTELPDHESVCEGAPLSDTEIAMKFDPGQTQRAANAADRIASTRCHVRTGCAPWSTIDSGARNTMLVSGGGFAFGFGTGFGAGGGTIVPIVDGRGSWPDGSVLVTSSCFGYQSTLIVADYWGAESTDMRQSSAAW